MTNRRQLLTGAAGIAAAALAGGTAARAQTKLPDAGPLGDVWLGPADAKVTIVEYASLTCSHCASFHAATWPELKKKYIDTARCVSRCGNSRSIRWRRPASCWPAATATTNMSR